MAGGRFAPGHLGELTQQLPFEMVDEALAATKTTQSRLRDLPSRVVVYLVLAACLFPEIGYLGVWRKLTAGLVGIPTVTPTAGGLSQARYRVGVAPLRWLFDLLCGPAATRRGPGTRWRGLLVCAIDGTTLTVPDSPRVLARFTKQRGNHGGTGYPQIRLVALLACGTRTVIDAVFGPTTTGETTYTPQLLRSLRPGMVLLGDRNFGAAELITQIAGTEADVIRLKNGRKMPVLARYHDGSYLSMLGKPRVRVIECEITISTPAGRQTGVYRLATTLLDPHRYPAGELIQLYHDRWEIETAYLELKSSILGGRVLRARTPTGIEQEVYALLVTYQLLRTAMTDATNTQPDIDPDRASFTIAYQTARDQVTQAANVIASTVIDLAGTIGQHVLANLMPTRRLRVCPRIIKRAISKYQARGPNINRTSYKATLTINILTGAPPRQHPKIPN
ncbi:MAG TPA: IS4 family transposase [Amycolatopsis sp.]|uniref:IS4 family transposase n=1 Tax=Amycolatopsis sp. TaxID=37632 RepID=UPI002B499E4D|nr:IS4 family transposase [Amycolatopsis sp.]HKS46193.1 IS4 family transposase [Amycolatopsis sp.]